jgi:hypothetical protein
MGEQNRTRSTEALERLTAVVLSTAHVTERDMRLIEERGRDRECPLSVADYAEGAWVMVPPADCLGGLDEFGFSASMTRVLQFAQRRGLPVVNLDRDGPELDTEELDRHGW